MPLYEHVVIARPDISGQQAEALLEEMKGIVAGLGGQVPKTEYWGLKNLSYRIRKHRKGHYGLLNIDAPPAALQELERRLKIHDDVIRFMTVRVEELEAGPSAPLQKGRDDRDGERRERWGDRPDRGDRGPRGPRGPRRDFGDRPPRDFGDRPPREDRAPRDDSGPREGSF